MHLVYNCCTHPKATLIATNTNASQQKSCMIIPKNISTAYHHKTQYSNKLDLYIDIDKIGFIDYKIKDEFLKKIHINQISIDAYHQRNGYGTYLIDCLKEEFDTISLLSIGKHLNIFYENNSFIEDLSEIKQRNNTNYVWTK